MAAGPIVVSLRTDTDADWSCRYRDYDVEQLLSRQMTCCLIGHELRRTACEGESVAADVGGEEQIWQRPLWPLRWQRLWVCNVQRGPKAATLEFAGQCGRVHDRPAGDIYNECPIRQRSENVRTDQTSGAVCQCDAENQNVGG